MMEKILLFFISLKEWLLIIIDKYTQFGPLMWFLMVMAEGLIPILPLILIVYANLYAFESIFTNKIVALSLTILLSSLATALGAILMFYFHRHVSKKIVNNKFNKIKFIKKVGNNDNEGWLPLFVISCIPFTPTSLINFYYGISALSTKTFINVTLIAKLIMITILVLTGTIYQQAITKNPHLSLVGLIITVILYIIAMKIDKIFKTKKQLNEV